MEQQPVSERTIALSLKTPTYGACVVGNDTFVDINRSIPPGADSFDVHGTGLIDVTIICDPPTMANPQANTKWPLNAGVKVVITSTEPSKDMNDSKVKVSYYGQNGKSFLGSAMLYLTSVEVSLDVDVTRIGGVTKGGKNKGTWTWGPNGEGAILLVNCDRDKNSSGGLDSEDDRLPNNADLKDMSPMILNAKAPEEFFDEHRVILRIFSSYASKLRVYRRSKFVYRKVLGSRKLSYEVERNNQDEIPFYVEGLQFPDSYFDGLVYIFVSVESTTDNTELFSEKVAFRMAPWIMTPNTLKPLEVYVCRVPHNQAFVQQIEPLVMKAHCSLNICGMVKDRGDRWIQDEMEFGYTEAPHKRFPVVLDSPRNRGLKNFPFKEILGPDFGYVTKEPFNQDEINTFDSFGNLEVSPPVTVEGKEYPLGRILIGSGTESEATMNKVVRDFLSAQKVQPPVELYSNWLLVGHVDEFMSFVPAPDQKGFRLLLASPHRCVELLKEKQKEGHGSARMFEGLDPSISIHRLSIDEILSNEELNQYFDFTQECIDTNRKILKKELGLMEADIIDIPILYHKEPPKETASSYFPNVVNMLVLGKYLGIPKPFGPLIKGRCCIEEKVQNLLEPLGLKCVFIDDFKDYYLEHGDVHCATNTLRKPFSKKWWDCIP